MKLCLLLTIMKWFALLDGSNRAQRILYGVRRDNVVGLHRQLFFAGRPCAEGRLLGNLYQYQLPWTRIDPMVTPIHPRVSVFWSWDLSPCSALPRHLSNSLSRDRFPGSIQCVLINYQARLNNSKATSFFLI